MQKHLGLIIVLLLLWAMPARAADPYVVTGVQVDVTAATAAKARDQAIKDASHKAFETLAAQISPGKPVPHVSDQSLGNMVSDFHIEQEQTAANRYVATFTFRFRQNTVRAAFGTRAIPSPKELLAHQGGVPSIGNNVVEDDSSTGGIDQIVASESQDADDGNSPPPVQSVSITPIPSAAIMVQVTAHDSRDLDRAMAGFRDVEAVQTVEYVSITPDKSILRLSYVGGLQSLLDQMQSHGISLRADNGTVPPLYILGS